MTEYPVDPIRDALCWFIATDETNGGGDQDEIDNKYWLAGRRAATQLLLSKREISVRTDRHEMAIAKQEWPPKLSDLPETDTPHQIIAAMRPAPTA